MLLVLPISGQPFKGNLAGASGPFSSIVSRASTKGNRCLTEHKWIARINYNGALKDS